MDGSAHQNTNYALPAQACQQSFTGTGSQQPDLGHREPIGQPVPLFPPTRASASPQRQPPDPEVYARCDRCHRELPHNAFSTDMVKCQYCVRFTEVSPILRETGTEPPPQAGPVPVPPPWRATGQGTSPVPAEATAAQSGSALGWPTTASLLNAQQMPAQAGKPGDGDRAWSKSGGTPYRMPHTSAVQEQASVLPGTAPDPARAR